jgi:hypothetical protein
LLNIIAVDLFIANSRKPTQNFVNPQMAPRQATAGGRHLNFDRKLNWRKCFRSAFSMGAIDFVLPLGQVPAIGQSIEGR